MQINRKLFPEIIGDNEEIFLSHLIGLIESVDELAILQITYSPNSYSFRIVPSLPKYNPLLLKELLNFHNMFHIQITLSKSIKSSATLFFEISL